MYPFVETLRIENGKIYNLPYHNARMNRTRYELFGRTDEINLSRYISPSGYVAPVKCRVEYLEEILKVEYVPYHIRGIRSLQIVECNIIDYRYKSTDRGLLNKLFDQRGEADDILIIRNGLVTDASSSNVAFYNGTEWYTPALPLLPGTTRARLLKEGVLKEQDIPVTAISGYQTICLFNAMIDFGKIQIPVHTLPVPAG